MAKKFKITCLACKKTMTKSQFEGCYNVGIVTLETGEAALPMGDGGMNWACPDYSVKVAKLVRQIQGILDPENKLYIHFPSLVSIDREVENMRQMTNIGKKTK